MAEFPEDMPLSERLRYTREERGLSQKAAAEIMGVSQNALSGWENGASPKRDQFAAIADFLATDEEGVIRLVVQVKSRSGSEQRSGSQVAASGIRVPDALTQEELALIQGYIDGIAARRWQS